MNSKCEFYGNKQRFYEIMGEISRTSQSQGCLNRGLLPTNTVTRNAIPYIHLSSPRTIRLQRILDRLAGDSSILMFDV